MRSDVRWWFACAVLSAGCGGDERVDATVCADGHSCDAMIAVDANADVGRDVPAIDIVMCAAPPTPAPAAAGPLGVYPAPRYVHLDQLGAHVVTACVDTSALASHATLDLHVAELARAASVTLGAAGMCPCDWTLTFESAPPALIAAAQPTWTSAGTNPERYVVVSTTTAGRAVTTMFAPTERAALWALEAAFALSQADPASSTGRRVADGTIVDYPSFAWRGIIEGTYSPQGQYGSAYSPGERNAILEVQARLRSNIYIYSPKLDPYARSMWQTPYPLTGAGWGQVIQTAVHQADANLMRFVWAISPGLSFDFSTAAYNALFAKLDAMRALGVRHFGLFMDDTSATNASATAALMNRVNQWLKTHDPTDHLLVVGVEYAGAPGSYLQTLVQTLDRDVEIMWTDPAICGPTLRASDLQPVATAIAPRPLSVWDNWPLGTGCFGGRSGDLHTVTLGYYTNPVVNEDGTPCMPHALPTRALFDVMGPIADYAWDSERYVANAGASCSAWAPHESVLVAQYAGCSPCVNDATHATIYPGWTCDTHDGTHTIYYCDGRTNCRTTLPCPGGCEYVSGQPDVCH